MIHLAGSFALPPCVYICDVHLSVHICRCVIGPVFLLRIKEVTKPNMSKLVNLRVVLFKYGRLSSLMLSVMACRSSNAGFDLGRFFFSFFFFFLGRGTTLALPLSTLMYK